MSWSEPNQLLLLPERVSNKFGVGPDTVEDPAAPFAPSHYRKKLLTIESLIELWLAIRED